MMELTHHDLRVARAHLAILPLPSMREIATKHGLLAGTGEIGAPTATRRQKSPAGPGVPRGRLVNRKV
jgi:hypothetical protein